MAANLADDETVGNDCVLYRRIPAKPEVYIVWNYNNQTWTISSQAFANHKDNPLAISVHLATVIEELGIPLDEIVMDRAKFALAAITAGDARGQHQVIQRHPEPDEPAHAHVLGNKPKSVQRALARVATWVMPPPDWPWPEGG